MVPETCGESWLSDWFARQALMLTGPEYANSFALQEGGDTATPRELTKVSDRGEPGSQRPCSVKDEAYLFVFQ